MTSTGGQFVAQELEVVFPNLVSEYYDTTKEDTYKTVKTSVLTPMLVKAIQEITQRLEVLEP